MEFVAVVGIVAVAVLLWLGWQKFMAPLAKKQQEGAEAEADRQRAAYEGLRRADPGFEMETFLQRAEMAFLMVKRAYQDRDVQAARAFLGPALWQQWGQDVQQLIAGHRRVVLEDLGVRNSGATEYGHGDAGDVIVVRFNYTAAVHMFDDRVGPETSMRYNQWLGESWTFARGKGVQTLVSGGITASRCPSCGGLLRLNDNGVCHYCQADITSGRYDWVTTEIRGFTSVAPAPAPSAAPGIDLTGLQALQAADPGFDVETFRARMQRAFIALHRAWQDRDLAASRPFMSPGLYVGWSTRVQTLIELHKVNVLEGLRLDGIDVIQAAHGNVFDNVSVRFTATCADYEVDDRSGRMVFGSRTPRPFTEYWAVQRSAGTRTTARSTMDSVCPNCGAPLQINQVGECGHCGAALTSGRFDWVVSRIERQETKPASATG